MASLLLKGVHKRLGLPSISSISCSSPDATSIVASTSTVVGGSGRAIDRHSPRLRDPHRSSSASYKPPRPSAAASSDDSKQQQQQHLGTKKKKSTAAASSEKTKRLASPATSSRFLLNSSRMQSDDLDHVLAPPPSSFVDVFPAGEGSLIDALPGTGNASLPLTLAKDKEAPAQQRQQQAAESSSSSSSSSASSSEITAVQEEEKEKAAAAAMARSSSERSRTTQAQAQTTVVLRVSLHCKGCAGKVKKHIAKMEGVSSFDVDIVSKKVTVVGDVTPLAVLSSVSKIKPAQFWPYTPQPPRVSASF